MMNYAIVFPAIVLALLTIAVGIWMGRMRLGALSRGEVDRSYFRLYQGAPPPDKVTQVSQHYDNLLALPMLFYVVVIFIIVTDSSNGLQLGLAWGFVASRLVHTMIHTTSNRLKYRFYAFSAGILILLAMWIVLLIQLLV